MRWDGDTDMLEELAACTKCCLLTKHVVHITKHNSTVLTDQTEMHIASLSRY
jgi:hypothetical protein